MTGMVTAVVEAIVLAFCIGGILGAVIAVHWVKFKGDKHDGGHRRSRAD